jgi:hypothetical protein
MHMDVPEVTDHAHAARHGSQNGGGAACKLL